MIVKCFLCAYEVQKSNSSSRTCSVLVQLPIWLSAAVDAVRFLLSLNVSTNKPVFKWQTPFMLSCFQLFFHRSRLFSGNSDSSVSFSRRDVRHASGTAQAHKWVWLFLDLDVHCEELFIEKYDLHYRWSHFFLPIFLSLWWIVMDSIILFDFYHLLFSSFVKFGLLLYRQFC